MQFAAARAALTSSGGKKDQILAQQSLVLSLLDTLSAALKPLQKLEQLLAYEALRDDAHPTINSLSAVAADVNVALAAHGVSPLSATVGEYFDEERHSRFARGGVVPSDDLLDDLLVREVVRPGYVHTATGTVLVPVLVHASSATAGTPNAAAATSAPVTETPRGTRVHEVASTDTLQGLCLRYNVQPQSLLRLNRLPNAQAIHARRTLRLPPLPSTAEPSSAAIREGGMEGGGGGAPVLVGGNGTHSSGGGGESGILHATTSPSLAARIAARRQSRASRPLGGGGSGSWRSDDGGGATGGGSGEEEVEEEADPRLVAELESALNWSVEKLQQQQQTTTSSSKEEGSSSTGKWRPDSELMEALGEAVRNALLQPWRAVASGSGEGEGKSEGGERLYLRALALHASERTLRALLSRDGELLDAFASELWKAMRRLVEEGDEAILDAKRTSTRRPSKASGEERIYARDSFDLV